MSNAATLKAPDDVVACTASLAVRSCQRRAWELLDGVIHSHIGAFLSDEGHGPRLTRAGCVPYCATGSLPERFLADIRAGAAALRGAFPGLVRTVERVSTATHGVTVEIVCQGTHTGPFYDLLSPTGRTVCFSELHDLVLEDGILVEAAVAVDVRSLLRQLTGVWASR